MEVAAAGLMIDLMHLNHVEVGTAAPTALVMNEVLEVVQEPSWIPG